MTPDRSRALRDLVRLHCVVYEVWPETSVLVDGRQQQVGFVVELYGVHAHPEGVRPGCVECWRTFSDLTEIAEAIVPTEERLSRYVIQPFDRSFHIAQERRFRTEVRLSLLIQHRSRYGDPVDDCERECLAYMRDRLKELGVAYKTMREG